MKQQTAKLMAAMLASLCLLFTGCAEKVPKPAGPPRASAAAVLVPQAGGTVVYGDGSVSLDASNTGDGYFMLRYTGDAQKVKAVVVAPDATSCSYPLIGGDYRTIPLTFGSGTYGVTVYEGIPSEERDDLYAAVFSQEVSAAQVDAFKPFLYPNQYVNFTADSAAVKQGEALAEDTYSDLDVISRVYNFVIGTIVYDEALAQTVSFGYIPDVDRTLTEKTGICFDYAALMTCMLRTQRIPTKLEVGYSGDKLHAWISAYVAESGWVNKIIEFNGSEWNLMDPTLAASNNAEAVKKYIGDGSKYLIKYQY